MIADPRDEALATLCDAAEEWAEWLDGKAGDLDGHGQLGRQAGDVNRREANAIRAAVLHFRPLRERDPDTDEWVDG